jgi:hypothetical protein
MNLPEAPIAHKGFFAVHFFTVSPIVDHLAKTSGRINTRQETCERPCDRSA